MKSKRTIIAVLILGLVANGCRLLGVDEDSPDIPGTIVFSAKDDAENPQYQLFVMNADGSGVRQLTEGDFYAIDPAWSPDGQHIAFASNQQALDGSSTLWVINPDGSNLEPLVRHPQTGRAMFGNHPAWSPDGTKISFDYCINCELGGGNHEIYVADLEKGTLDTLVQHPASDNYPTWSPDGKRIAFVSGREYYMADTLRFRKDLYVINTDGSNLNRLTETGYAHEPVWNPDGDAITFRSTSNSSGLYQINLSSRGILKIKEDVSEHVQLHPNQWRTNGTQLLVLEWEREMPWRNSLSILNSDNNQLKIVYSKHSDNSNPNIVRGDWFIPKNN